jgi:hypothetical protein
MRRASDGHLKLIEIKTIRVKSGQMIELPFELESGDRFLLRLFSYFGPMFGRSRGQIDIGPNFRGHIHCRASGVPLVAVLKLDVADMGD